MKHKRCYMFIITSMLLFVCNTYATTSKFISDDEYDKQYDTNTPVIHDRYEKFNRAMFGFNRFIDRILIKPYTIIYDTAVPKVMQYHIKNVCSNINEPLNALYGALQGDKDKMFRSLARFVFNSTIGVLGLFDVAGKLGVPAMQRASFGHVINTYGGNHGPYIVLPFLGANTADRAFGSIVDIMLNPTNFLHFKHASSVRNTYRFFDILTTRQKLLAASDNLDYVSLDEYAMVRSVYYQELANIDNKKRS